MYDGPEIISFLLKLSSAVVLGYYNGLERIFFFFFCFLHTIFTVTMIFNA